LPAQYGCHNKEGLLPFNKLYKYSAISNNSSVCCCSLSHVHQFICLLVQPVTCPPIHHFMYTFLQSFNHSYILSLWRSFVRSINRSFFRSSSHSDVLCGSERTELQEDKICCRLETAWGLSLDAKLDIPRCL
jgi:hypothetical protein